MTSFHQNTGLLQLPHEILGQIIDYSRPYEFEALLLTCKQLYSAGFHLIKDHNFCKTWDLLQPKPKGHINDSFVSTCYPIEFFENLSEAPPRLQELLICYSTGISVDRPTSRRTVEVELCAMQKLCFKMPWLRFTLLQIFEDLPEITEYFKCAITLRSCILNEPGWNLSAASDGLKDLINLYTTLIALLLFNVKGIYVDERFSMREDQISAQIWPRLIGSRLFWSRYQRLETICIDDIYHPDFDMIAPLTLLPELKYLKMSRHYKGFKETRDPSRFSWPPGERKKSPLMQLIFHCSIIGPKELELLLQHVESLQSLVLEFEVIHSLVDDSDEEDTAKYERGRKIVEGRWDCDTKWELCKWPPPVRAEETLQSILAQTMSSRSLKHLAIASQPEHTIPWTDPKQLIVHFKDFEYLTHLEFNIYLLRPSNYKIWSGRVEYLPRSLVEILPSSIEVVRLIIDTVHYRVFDRLLERIPSERKTLPALRKILLRLPEGFANMLYFPFEEDQDYYRSFRRWREPLNAVGIELDIQVYSEPEVVHCIESFNEARI